jgi:hypothetical protein
MTARRQTTVRITNSDETASRRVILAKRNID